MKTHPNAEEWMSFLYQETSSDQTSELDAHLRQCAECQRQVAQWRGSMASLEAWKMPSAARRQRRAAPVLQWAAAAAVVLAVGFGVGRMTSPSSARLQQLEMSLRAEMETKLAAGRAEMAASLDRRNAEMAPSVQAAAGEAAKREAEALLVKFAKSLDGQREADRDAFVAALRNLEERRASEFATLRKDLDTLAVNADDGLSRTHETLMELASMAQPPATDPR